MHSMTPRRINRDKYVYIAMATGKKYRSEPILKGVLRITGSRLGPIGSLMR